MLISISFAEVSVGIFSKLELSIKYFIVLSGLLVETHLWNEKLIHHRKPLQNPIRNKNLILP